MTLSLLAIDASTDTVHLALSVGAAVRTRALPAGAQASAVLLPAVQALLAEAQLALTALDAVAFGRGPGAFTGLRTAAAVAQGLACGIDRPVLALDTLAVVAESARRAGAPSGCVWAAIDARMGEIYAAPWQHQADGTWLALADVALYSPASLADRLNAAFADATVPTRPTALAGNALLVHGAALEDGLGAAASISRWPQAVPDGEALAALAQAAWLAGQQIDPALALPLYVRDKVAQTTAERLAARQAADTAAAGDRT
ncbi:MAG: tRNA (adenosine(37)-N6)-threonylcarbamoyltransferase complex dimerization subunit type 1 TsaB [Leptothrix sp. (in: b-proteobacteria)]